MGRQGLSQHIPRILSGAELKLVGSKDRFLVITLPIKFLTLQIKKHEIFQDELDHKKEELKP
jgi:hypothetical protein